MTRKMLLAMACAMTVAGAARAETRGPPPSGEPVVTYVVRRGDRLWTLADRYFVRRPTWREVRVRNHVRNVRRLTIGLTLEIPTRLLKVEPIEAHLGAFRGAVTIGGGAAALGMLVPEGAVVATQGGAFARLDLPDGSRVSVPSQSRLRVDALRRILLTGAVERAFTVLSGRSESTVTPLTGPQDSYRVRTPVSVAAVRGTDFRVVYAPDDNLASTGVVEGQVGVEAGGGSAVAPAGFGVAVKPGAPPDVVPLLPAPALVEPGRVQDAPEVSFDVGAVAGARGYRLQLAADAGMLDIFAERSGDSPHLQFDGLPDGDYFVRATALDPAWIEGLPRTYAFERALNTLTALGVAPSGTKGDRRFLIKWEAAGAGERTYRVQVVRVGSTEGPVVDAGGLKETQLTVTNLPPGDYRWQVMSATFRNGRYIEKWSVPQTFTVAE